VGFLGDNQIIKTVEGGMKKRIPFIILLVIAIFWGITLKNEFLYVLNWWALFLLIGLLFMPLSMRIFPTFTDKGYLFSKVIGLAISSYVLWLFANFKIIPITVHGCWGVVAACGIAVYMLFYRKKEAKDINLFSEDTITWATIGESIFLLSLSFWTYLRGFNPKLEGLEKFMDYGFVNSILKSRFIPPNDMWFAGESINYYYYGQYVTAFLTRLTGIKTEISYNLMMATLFAFSMALCFSIVSNMLKGYGVKKNSSVITGGLIASTLVSLGGNSHSFFYGFLPKIIGKGGGYWFPNATRYIGYDPETNDKTIHEFPLYSFVVSDLHAHVVNMIFVLTIIGIFLAVFKKLQKRADESWHKDNPLLELFFPELILIGLFIGIFQMSNYWDFPIYLTVCLFTLIFAGLRNYESAIKFAGVAAIRFLLVVVMSLAFALPFNLNFDTITTEIRLTTARSLPHQLLVLWGYQLLLVIIFCVFIFFFEQNIKWRWERGKAARKKLRNELTLFKRIQNVFLKNPIEDVFALILCVSAIGLVIIPELVYVKDIYEASHKRANTMFKLTYQAFIMFGLVAGYIVIRIRQFSVRDWKVKTALITSVVILFIPMVYPFYAISSWYNKMNPEYYKGLDGLAFLKEEYPDDYALVEWLRENIEEQPVVLESNGDSYTYHGRISMSTGLPTIQGWYVHEWLWRGSSGLVQERVDEVKIIYESDDIYETERLLLKYNVQYIVIGKLEHKQFGALNESKLLSLGDVVFEKPEIKLVRVRLTNP
jgi:YYY domain-containing protein